MKLKSLVAASLLAITSLSSQAVDVDWGAHGILETSGAVAPAAGSFLDTYSFTLGTTSSLSAAFAAAGITFGALGIFSGDGTQSLYSWGFGGTTALADTVMLDAGSYIFAVSGRSNGSAAYSLSSVATAVPEPETYALLLAGLGAVGFVARRRKES